jgi:hypothetical protein
MGNYQGIGEVTQSGQHLSTVKYSVETEPLEGEIEIDKGEQYLSRHDRFTLHMQGGIGLVFRITHVTDGVMGKYHIKGIGDLARSS